jgi:hypothetical protein
LRETASAALRVSLIRLGVISALPAVATGWSDWLDTDGAESRVGLVHAVASAFAVRGHRYDRIWSGPVMGSPLMTASRSGTDRHELEIAFHD